MSRRRWWGGVTLALLAAAALAVASMRTRALPYLGESPTRRLVGAFHLHSEDSHDSSLSWDTLALAARDLGLDFLIMTDHNKQRAAPASLHGVTLLSYAELSTGFGHAVALGARYTIDKNQRNDPNVLAHMRQAGGFSVLTHPSDLKRPWTGPHDGVNGIEVANISASARRLGGPLLLGLIPLAAAWPWQPTLAFAQLYDRDTQALGLWDTLPPPAIGLCGSDTHGWVTPSINLAAWFVTLDTPVPPGHAPGILQAMVRGQFHCSAGLLGRQPTFAFFATQTVPEGAEVVAPPQAAAANKTASLTLTGPQGPEDALELVLIRDGRIYTRGAPPTLTVLSPPPGVWRAEIRARIPGLLWGAHWVPAFYSQRLVLAGPPA